MLDAMVQDFERGTGPWQAGWIALPDSFLLTSGALRAGRRHARRTHGPRRKNARENLNLSNGLIVSEAVDGARAAARPGRGRRAGVGRMQESQ